MSDSYVNNYVIQIESGHGNTNYKIISTREGLTELVRTLTAKLEIPEQHLPNTWKTEDSSFLLWSDYATVAQGQTARIYLSFALAKDLASYHTRPSLFKRFLFFLGCIFVVGILVLAVIGGVTVIRGGV
jgi:hypothetical protein